MLFEDCIYQKFDLPIQMVNNILGVTKGRLGLNHFEITQLVKLSRDLVNLTFIVKFTRQKIKASLNYILGR